MNAKKAPESYSEDKLDKMDVNTSGSGHILNNGKGTTPKKPANMLAAMKRRATKC